MNTIEYYNTTGVSGEALKVLSKKAHTQDIIILEYFKNNPFNEVSASQIDAIGILPIRTPLTSIRRAINTLLNAGLIKRAGETKGIYGRIEFTYKLK